MAKMIKSHYKANRKPLHGKGRGKLCTFQRGKDFFINDKGQTMRIKKKYSRYLKLAK